MDEDVKVLWPVEALVSLGFNSRDADRLHRLLPPVATSVISATVDTPGGYRPYRGITNPAAHVIWATHSVTPHQATALANAGRGLVDVLVILDAVHDHVHRRLSIEGFDVVLDWALERRVPRDRIGYYIALGFPAASAAAIESEGSERPAEVVLETLSALRHA